VVYFYFLFFIFFLPRGHGPSAVHGLPVVYFFLTARQWAERGSWFTRGLLFFLLFSFFSFVGDQNQTSTRPNFE